MTRIKYQNISYYNEVRKVSMGYKTYTSSKLNSLKFWNNPPHPYVFNKLDILLLIYSYTL